MKSLKLGEVEVKFLKLEELINRKVIIVEIGEEKDSLKLVFEGNVVLQISARRWESDIPEPRNFGWVVFAP